MTVAASLGPFVGHAAELEMLRAELATVRSRTPRVVVVQGTPESARRSSSSSS